jgi:YceI-like domain
MTKCPKPALFCRTAVACALLFLSFPAFLRAQSSWVLKQSSLTYHVSHPMHHVDGVSHDARGKGVCQNGQCSFLIAVPVKSFDSGDTNRDLHMLEVTRGAQFPMVEVRTQLPQPALNSSVINVDLEIQFAGQTAHFHQIPLHLSAQHDQVRLTGTIPATLADFKISPPELLFVPIKNEIPVDIDMTWEKEK